MKLPKGNNLRDFIRPEVIQTIQGLDLKARAIVEGFVAGLHKSPRHGFSVEFNQHKQYSSGDDLRYIDWRVYGKTDRFYVKEFEEETNTRVYLVIDGSHSMSYKMNGKLSKYQYSVYLASALAYLTIKQKDAPSLVMVKQGVEKFIPPSAKDIQLKNILQVLGSVKPGGKTDLQRSLTLLAGRIRKRSLVVIFSDLLDQGDKIRRSLEMLRFRNNEILIFHVLDRSEIDFPFKNQVRFVDLESGEKILTDISSVKEGYMKSMKIFLNDMKDYCTRNRIDYNLLNTDDLFSLALKNYLVRRKRMS